MNNFNQKLYEENLMINKIIRSYSEISFKFRNKINNFLNFIDFMKKYDGFNDLKIEIVNELQAINSKLIIELERNVNSFKISVKL